MEEKARKRPLEIWAGFETTKTIIAALMDDDTHRIGICWVGGEGMTRMTSRIFDEVKRQKLFGSVMMLSVGASSAPETIAHGIYDQLSVRKFQRGDGDVVAHTAALLSKLAAQGRLLMILDDVWEVFDLERAGIPKLGSCKIVIVSLFNKVCLGMGCKPIFKLQQHHILQQSQEGTTSSVTSQQTTVTPGRWNLVLYHLLRMMVTPRRWNLLPTSSRQPQSLHINHLPRLKANHLPRLKATWRYFIRDMRMRKDLSHRQRGSQASGGNIAENLSNNFIIEKNIFSDSNQNRGQIEEMNNEAKSEVSMNEVLVFKRYLQDFTLFCSVLPHYYEFTKDILVWQWMVGGLIELGEDKMEEVCMQCFDTLLDMDYFVPSGYDYIFHQMKYRIGDGMTVFLQKQTLEPKFGKYFDCKTSYASEVEHMSLTFKDIKCMKLGVLKQYSRLQTLVIYGSYGVDHLPSDIFLKLKTLKILNLSGTNIAVLPSSIENLKELRFFDMSKTPIRWLPETICHFSHLQTLNLDGCLQLGRLPKCTDKLINLQHLILDVRQLQSMPVGIWKLSNLQTLNAFLVGESCVGELKHLKKLRGSFCLLNLENVGSKEEASDACLHNKVGLSKIELQWSDIQDEKCPSEGEILESLQPPISIQELKIQFYSGGVLPSWICDPSFRNLASIILYGCRYCSSLPSLGELPSLKSLSIIENNEVVEIDSSFFRKQANQNLMAFPKLEKLSFESMSKLEKWTGLENGDFPSLRHLIIEYCPKFVGLPFLSYLNSLLQLEIRYCSELSCLPEDGPPPSLKSLMIKQTPKLKAQCCDEQWEGWPKIARVPAIYIDDREFSPKASS